MSARRPPRRPWALVVALAAFACEPWWTGFGAHACALIEDGSVWCWGYNAAGQLGDGTVFDRAEPVAVLGLAPSRSVAAGSRFTCAASADGEVACWGRNDLGQLGDGGPAADRATPGPVPGLAGVARVAAGVSAACAVLEGGAVWCWGRLERVVRAVPEPVAGLPSAAIDAVVGWGVACALLAGGDVWCWGEGLRATPAGISGAAAIALPGELPCAALQDGSVTCASPPSGAAALGGSHAQACAVLADGEVSCWGTEPFGPPERFGEEAPFGPDPYASGATGVAVGDGFACARLASGGISCWGDNWSGQLGDGTDRARSWPVPISGLPGAATAVTASRGRVVWDYGCGTSAAPGDECS